ncbi:MAG: TrmH family RNA methyltransferase [Ignavibacteriaceae bacterium]
MRTNKRIEKIKTVLENRQSTLHLVMENIHDPHNVSAILRTCDAVGVDSVSLLYYIEKFPKIGKKSSASAGKWVKRKKYTSVEVCFNSLKKDNYKIYSSYIGKGTKNLFELDLSEKVALVMGNEHRGISEEVVKNSDELFYIPMYGMVQSLNVSVATAITLYEAMRQRMRSGLYGKSSFTEEEFNNRLEEWIKK